MQQRKKLSLSFTLSLALHGLVVILLLTRPSLDMKDLLQKPPPTSVDLMDPKELLEALQKAEKDKVDGQIVDQDKNRLNDEKPKDAKFLSRHDQKVVQESVAANVGKFKNSDNSSGEKARQPEAAKPQEKIGQEADKNVLAEQAPDALDSKEKLADNKNGIATKSKPALKDLIPSFKPAPPPVESAENTQGGGKGPSATDDNVKNVAKGMQTLLSTREFVYFSYYNRIKDKLRQYWEPKIKEKMERIIRQGRTIASDADRITRVVIILDKTGTLVRVQVVGPSGVTDLDDAAVEAFRAAAPFPNPPKGIIETDGTIKIRWDFILEANAGGIFNAIRLAKQQI